MASAASTGDSIAQQIAALHADGKLRPGKIKDLLQTSVTGNGGLGGLGSLANSLKNLLSGTNFNSSAANKAAAATPAASTNPAQKPLNDGTLAGRVAEITASGSPLMRQAATVGRQEVNRRGLGNSSMAIGAAQQKMVEAATPIASQEFSEANARKLQEMQNAQQTKIQDMQNAQSTKVAQMELAGKEREQIAASITQMAGYRYQALANTLNNADIPASERAAIVNSINAQHADAMNNIQNLYGVAINPGTTTSTTGTTANYDFTVKK